MFFAQGVQLFEGTRTEKFTVCALVVSRSGNGFCFFQPLTKGVLRRIFRLLPCLERSLSDRTIPGASAEIPAKLVIELPLAVEILAVIALEHRHDDPRRAVAALRAVAFHHGLLDRVQFAVGQALHGDQLPPMHRSQRRQAAVE